LRYGYFETDSVTINRTHKYTVTWNVKFFGILLSAFLLKWNIECMENISILKFISETNKNKSIKIIHVLKLNFLFDWKYWKKCLFLNVSKIYTDPFPDKHIRYLLVYIVNIVLYYIINNWLIDLLFLTPLSELTSTWIYSLNTNNKQRTDRK
jgi:hypothetical protein